MVAVIVVLCTLIYGNDVTLLRYVRTNYLILKINKAMEEN